MNKILFKEKEKELMRFVQDFKVNITENDMFNLLKIKIKMIIEDKNKIAKALSDLGVDYLEGGWPGANTLDTAFFTSK